MWLLLLWPVVGVIGGGLLWLTMFDMDIADVVFLLFVGTLSGPAVPLALGTGFALSRIPKGPLIRRFGYRKGAKP